MIYFIDLRAESAGGNPVATVDDIMVRSDAEPMPSRSFLPDLQQAIQGRDVLLATHGFNVNRDKGLSELAHWNEWLNLGGNGYYVALLWPGDSRWLPVVDYPVEDREAIQSAQLLSQFLKANFPGVNSLTFASHSLGARVVLEAIRNLGGAFKINGLTMMAGAISDTCLSDEYRASLPAVRKISVLASDCDEVLKLAFPLGNPLAGIVSRGDPYWHGALGRFGPNPPGQPANLVGSPILPNVWNFGHGSYIGAQNPIDPPNESPPFFPPDVVVPQNVNAPPSNARNWQQAWAAGFTSTRFA